MHTQRIATDFPDRRAYINVEPSHGRSAACGCAKDDPACRELVFARMLQASGAHTKENVL
jgi:hypothetical protein